MADLEPQVLLPAHGAASTDPAEIVEVLRVHAEALEFIVSATLAGLNEGKRKDQVFQSIALPDHLARHPALDVQYVTAKDISKMVIRRYTGWWDDHPSHWSPAPMEHQAQTLADLAGGIDALVGATRDLIASDVQMACHLADWAWLAAPDEPSVQQLVIDTYLARSIDDRSNTQEILAYLDAITRARERQLASVP